MQCADVLAHGGWEYGEHLGKEVDRLGRVLPKRARTVVGVFRCLEICVEKDECLGSARGRSDFEERIFEAFPEGAF